MAHLMIPTPLRKFTEGRSRFQADASTVQDLMAALVVAHPGLKIHLFDEAGTLRHFIRIYVGDEDISQLQSTSTPLGPDSEVSIIPAIAGGSPNSRKP
jgi:molybdopterin converting factor small subunit